MEGEVEAEAIDEVGAHAKHAGAAFLEALERAFGDGARVEPKDGVRERGERELMLGLETSSGTVAVFGFDKAGAAALVMRLLRSGSLERDILSRGARALHEALGAVLAREVAVALGTVARETEPRRQRFTHRLECAVVLGTERHTVSLWLAVPDVPLASEWKLRLPLVVAVSAAERGELAGLAPGDLWLPESGWLLNPHAPSLSPAALSGRALLGTLDGESLWVVVDARGATITGPRVSLDAVCGLPLAGRSEPSAGTQRADWARVHIEVGYAEVTLEDAAGLRPGSHVELLRTGSADLSVDGRLRARGVLEATDRGVGLRIERLGVME